MFTLYYFYFMIWTYTLEELKLFARELLLHLPNHGVVAFYGPMGVGKTTLICELCKLKGVKDTISSPTFSLINDYLNSNDSGSSHIYHMDMYRIKDAVEAVQAGVEDCLFSGFLCLVEWPERIEELLPDKTNRVFLSLESSGKRICKLEKPS